LTCPACGGEILEGDRFCRGCGRALHAPQPTPQPVRRPAWLTGSSLALLLIAVLIFLAATNPTPDAYVAWAADSLAPAATGFTYRSSAYAIARSTVAESYGICTVFQTSLAGGGQTTVLGILDRFVTIRRSPGAAIAPGRQRRRRRNSSGQVQI
jgi:hypothetical protein